MMRRCKRTDGAKPESGGDGDGVIPLTDLPSGSECEIVRVEPRRRRRADHLAAYGVTAGTHLRLQQKFPTFVVRIAETDLALDSDVASDIMVRVEPSRRT